MQILENNNLIIETKSSGAELTRIYSKKYKKEILWNGDKKYWRRQSPILFPIVGKLKEDKTLIEGEIYNINQHGFARDMDFDLINNDENTITYKLTSNEKTIKIYPYNFNLFISYTIVEEKVKITWNVQNIDSKDIYFSIGGHPAFNISSPENLREYYIEFKCRKNVQKINLEGPYYSEIDEINSLSKLKLNPGLFENDAIIYTNIDEISLKSTKEEFYINVNFEGFPLVGIWTPYYKGKNSTAPFISIEPWYGIADGIDSNDIYKNKKYINKLNIGDSFEVSYYIEVK
ncbi:aldose 1-epimerase family protein [Terrisporobacter petrolearius]|uniref:aldose 1-epimerase family protein n=1 Tax=Terrisporobacter petrolearius TaxID=1460447 RepID=UPI001D16B8F9|nr:aldose 1-epimerase family protein [Terrisporobacter petrolearius]MCC3863252.1 aldose 1-epimerase family protein [Terrisporobacter petrolearius]